MIRNRELWEAWEKEYIRSRPPNYEENLRIVEWLYEEARILGVWQRLDPMEGIEVKIRLARVINVSTTPAATGKRPGTG